MQKNKYKQINIILDKPTKPYFSMTSQYHKLSKVFALLANSNPRLNIWDRMCIHQTVNEYFMENENKNHMYENRIKELEYKLEHKLENKLDNKIEQLTNELDNLKKNSCGCSCRQ